MSRLLQRHVIIVGGGASAALLATHIVRGSPDALLTIVEPREHLGRGMAYGTDCAFHLLNVPAGKMSAFPDDPGHFLRWLQRRDPHSYETRSFAPRAFYGAYLSGIVAETRAAAGNRFQHIRDVACDANVDASGVRVQLGTTGSIHGDVLVLAIGNAAPADWPSMPSDVLASPHFFGSAWDPRALLPADPDETILLLGTGLTAADAVLGLRSNGHRGTIAMVSRRGLLPHEHRLFDAPPPTAPEAKNITELIEALRAGDNWRLAVDGVRPATNALWQSLDADEQRRFFRHLEPYWNVHRHRMAPEIAEELAALTEAGTLRMIAGRVEAFNLEPGAIRVPIQLRRGGGQVTIEAARVINCSGPEHDVRKLPNPLVKSLLARGRLAPHPLGFGLQVAASGALIDDRGRESSRLFAIGPVRFGTLIETTAIPEIRVQAVELAQVVGAALAADGVPIG